MVNDERDVSIWIPTPAELAEQEQREAGPMNRRGREGRAPRRGMMNLSTRVTRGIAPKDGADG